MGTGDGRLWRCITAVVAMVAPIIAPSGSQASTDDPYFHAQFGAEQIRVEEAWERSRGDDVVVAVIDTGVDFTHPDLMANLMPGNTFLSCGDAGCGSGEWRAEIHGTAVTGTVAAIAGNGRGVAGIAPEADVLSVNVLDARGTWRDLALGIRWAVDHGADVINLSLGDNLVSRFIDGDEKLARDAIADANARGVVVVAAAMNAVFSGGATVVCDPPAWNPGVLCVASTTRQETPSEFSSFPTKPDLLAVSAPGGSLSSVAAPLDPALCGNGVITTLPPGTAWPTVAETCGYAGAPEDPDHLGYDEVAGTSIASPHVAGAAALLVAMGCEREQTLSLLTSTARNPITGARGVWDPRFGYGIIDAGEATRVAEDTCAREPRADRRPVASDDHVAIGRGAAATIDVLQNDADPEGKSLALVAVSTPTQGRVSIAGGALTYRATRQDRDTDTFRYTVRDPHGNVSAATVRLSLSGDLPFVETRSITLHLDGSDDESCRGVGNIDTVRCAGPWLTEGGDSLNETPAVSVHNTSGPLGDPDPDPRAPHDSQWTWLVEEPVKIGGTASVTWWSRCDLCVVRGFEEWVIEIWVDGHRVGASRPLFTRTSATDRTTATVDLGPLTDPVVARESITVNLSTVDALAQQASAIFYDSHAPCPGATDAPCDSTVELLLVT